MSCFGCKVFFLLPHKVLQSNSIAMGRRTKGQRESLESNQRIVRVSRIRFTQPTISPTFKDGAALSGLIISALADSDCLMSSFGRPPWRQRPPPLECCEIGKARWLSLDNRRLFCYYAASSYLQRDLLVCIAVTKAIPRGKAFNVQNWKWLQFKRARRRIHLKYPRRVHLPYCSLYASMDAIVDSICL